MKQITAMLLAGNDPAALAAAARSFADLTITETQVAAINVPTTAIVGTADTLIERVNKLKKAMPELNVVPVEKATHLTVVGRPEFVAVLLDFLKANSIKK